MFQPRARRPAPGALTTVSGREVAGWVMAGAAGEPLTVVLEIDGIEVARTDADLPTEAYDRAATGFRFAADTRFTALGGSRYAAVRVFVERDGGGRDELARSPQVLVLHPDVERGGAACILTAGRTRAVSLAHDLRAAHGGSVAEMHGVRDALDLPDAFPRGCRYVVGDLPAMTARQAGLVDYAWVLLLADPVRHLRETLAELCDGRAAPLRGGAEADRAWLDRLAAVDTADAPALAACLADAPAAIRALIDNPQCRLLLPPRQDRIGPRQGGAAQRHLGWFDAVAVDGDPGAGRNRVGRLYGIPEPVGAGMPASAPTVFDSIPESVLAPFVEQDRALIAAARSCPERPPGVAWRVRSGRRALGAERLAADRGDGRAAPDASRRPFAILRAPEPRAKRTLVVLGVSRGGTSMVAGTLRLAGVFMGQRLSSDSHEDRDFHVHDRRTLRRLIAERNAAHAIWGWKYPHAFDYLARIRGSLRNPRFIVVFRDAVAVAQAFNRADGMPFDRALREAEARYRRLARFVARCRDPVLAISYEKALADREGYLLGLADFCGLHPSPEQFDACRDFVSPGDYVRLRGGPGRVRRQP